MGTSVCPVCGEPLHEQTRIVRCRHCSAHASNNLTLCPNCGRELRAAPPRFLVWGLPFVVALLMLIVLAGRWDQIAAQTAITSLPNDAPSLFSRLGQALNPGIQITTVDENGIPLQPIELGDGNSQPGVVALAATADGESGEAEGDGENAAVNSATASEEPDTTDANAPAAATMESVEVVVTAEVLEPVAVAAVNSPTAAPAATATPTQAATATPSPSATSTATAASTATPTANPTSPATATARPTVVPTRALAARLEGAAISSGGSSGDKNSANKNSVVAASASAGDSTASSESTVAADNTITLTAALLADVVDSITGTLAVQVTTAETPAIETPTAEATPTDLPATETPATATATAETPTVAPIQPPQLTYVIQEGDTLNDIANRYGVGVEPLMAVNGLTAEDVLSLRPGQTLAIPGVPGNAAPLATAPPASAPAAPLRYTVQEGDFPFNIASKFGVSVDALLAANNLTREDATRLQTGQVLIIPAGSAAPSGDAQSSAPAGEAIVAAGATTGDAEIGDAQANEAEAFRLQPPTLVGPESGTPFRCDQRESLAWSAVPFIGESDRYELNLGYVSALNESGGEVVAWAYIIPLAPNLTSWRLDPTICGDAPQEFGRRWRWFVQVVQTNGDGNRLPVSPPSEIRGFLWN